MAPISYAGGYFLYPPPTSAQVEQIETLACALVCAAVGSGAALTTICIMAVFRPMRRLVTMVYLIRSIVVRRH